VLVGGVDELIDGEVVDEMVGVEGGEEVCDVEAVSVEELVPVGDVEAEIVGVVVGGVDGEVVDEMVEVWIFVGEVVLVGLVDEVIDIEGVAEVVCEGEFVLADSVWVEGDVVGVCEGDSVGELVSVWVDTVSVLVGVSGLYASGQSSNIPVTTMALTVSAHGKLNLLTPLHRAVHISCWQPGSVADASRAAWLVRSHGAPRSSRASQRGWLGKSQISSSVSCLDRVGWASEVSAERSVVSNTLLVGTTLLNSRKLPLVLRAVVDIGGCWADGVEIAGAVKEVARVPAGCSGVSGVEGCGWDE